jgi:uncharacterized Zn-finger protein
MPAEYYTSPPPTSGSRRFSASSTESWTSSCDSSLPSTPGGAGFAFHPVQQKQHTFTDTMMMDEDMDESYCAHSIAPKLLSFHQYSQQAHHHQQHLQQHQQQQISHMEHDHGMADDAPSHPHCRSRSECRDAHDSQNPTYHRKHSVDTIEAAFATYHDSGDFCDSPESLVYSPGPEQERYHPASSPDCTPTGSHHMFEYPSTSSSCNDAALAALRLCYYPTSPPTSHSRKRSFSKKPKCTGLGRLPVVVSSDDKPHICGIGACNARFKRQEHLRRHERTHTDERPFSCEVCGRKFSRTDNLRMHRKTHMKKTGRNVYVAGLAE